MKHIELYIVLAVSLLAVSCQKEELEMYGEDGEIVFSFSDALETKGVPATTVNLDSLYAGGISIQAFNNGSSFFASGEYLTYSKPDEVWKTNKKKAYLWPNYPSEDKQKVDFWAWAPMVGDGGLSNVSIDNAAKILSFHYKVPEESTPTGNAAKCQDDVIVAAAFGQTKSASVSLNYDHPLASLRFVVGKTNAGKVSSITLKGLKSSGDCAYKPQPGSGEQMFTWTNLTGSADYTQNFNVDVHENLNVDGTPVQDLSDDKDGTLFMVIPQEVNGIQISVVFVTGTETKTFVTTLNEDPWLAGQTYTYKLGITDGLKVSVTSTASGPTESDLVITNSGQAKAYARAAIVANWVDSAGHIVAPWTLDISDTSFIKDGSWDTFWKYDSDQDIYYYRKPLEGGSATECKLFDSYTITLGAEEKHEGQTLKFSVLVQFVKYDSEKAAVKTAWGEVAASYLEPSS